MTAKIHPRLPAPATTVDQLYTDLIAYCDKMCFHHAVIRPISERDRFENGIASGYSSLKIALQYASYQREKQARETRAFKQHEYVMLAAALSEASDSTYLRAETQDAENLPYTAAATRKLAAAYEILLERVDRMAKIDYKEEV